MVLAAITFCNAVFLYSSMQKKLCFEKFASHLPVSSNKDVIVISKETSDISELKSFDFPHLERVKAHKDVSQIEALTFDGEYFSCAEGDPEVCLIKLNKSASQEKWVNTLKNRPNLIAMTPVQYKHLYNKAMIAKNEALKAHFSLLSLISLISFFGIIFSTAILPFMFKKEMWILSLEKVSFSSMLGAIGISLSLLTLAIPMMLSAFGLLVSSHSQMILKISLHSVVLQVLTVFVMSAAITVAGKGEYGKSRVF